MKKRNLVCGAVCLTLAGSMVLSSCGKKDKKIDSETTPLVVSSEALDSVFNPYFYTTGPDGNVVGQTQIGMLSTDKEGNIVCGENEPCVVLDYATHTVGTQQDYEQSGNYDNYYTDYWFAIKNGIKFSDGSDLTIRDVLFNLYVLLDPPIPVRPRCIPWTFRDWRPIARSRMTRANRKDSTASMNRKRSFVSTTSRSGATMTTRRWMI